MTLDHDVGDAAQLMSVLPRAVPAEQLISLHNGAPLTLRAHDSGAAVLCFTSGTTAAPKVVLQCRKSWHAPNATCGGSQSTAPLDGSELCHCLHTELLAMSESHVLLQTTALVLLPRLLSCRMRLSMCNR
jgi:acyl-CoA synthetase (AMP-forming)/AMP-acid ligase II